MNLRHPKIKFMFLSLIFIAFIFSFNQSAAAQRIAVLAPDKEVQSEMFAEKIAVELSSAFKVLDKTMSETAFDSAGLETPFNLTLSDARRIGSIIGADFYFLVRSKTVRRFSLMKNEYSESYAAIYVVSSRTGRLIRWDLMSKTAADGENSVEDLFELIADYAKKLSNLIKLAAKSEITDAKQIHFLELSLEDGAEAVNLRSPLPFKRISPQYTEMANLYGIEATVDISLDIDQMGKIVYSEVERWAGFGLDESVSKAVTEMNWRPADRNGKTISVRVLLRYNFRKIGKL